MMKPAIALIALTLAGAAQAGCAVAPSRVAMRGEVARLAAQRAMLEERMARLQLAMLVDEVLTPEERPSPAPKAEVAMVSYRR